MIKTLKNLFKQDKEKFVVPKSVQSVIPIKTIWEDGVFLVGKNKYAKTFKFEDPLADNSSFLLVLQALLIASNQEISDATLA